MMDFIVGTIIFIVITVITIVSAVGVGIAMAIFIEEVFNEQK